MNTSLFFFIRKWSAVARSAALAAVAFGLTWALPAQSLFVATWGNGTSGAGAISTYGLDGSLQTAGLITGLTQPVDLAIGGGGLYVVSASGGSVGKYDLNGTGGTWLSGLSNPVSVALSGADVLVATADGTVSRYNESGIFQDSFSTGFSYLSSMAVSGSSIYVAGQFDSAGTIAAFSMSGGVGTTLVSGVTGPGGLSTAGSTLYYFTQPSGYTVWSYDTAAETPVPSSIVTGLNGATSTLSYNGDLYVSVLNGGTTDGFVGIYAGATNPSFLTGVNEPYALAVGGAPIPEPATYAVLAGAAMLGFAMWRRRTSA